MAASSPLTLRERALVRLAVREVAREYDPRREWLSVSDVAGITGFSRKTVFEWMAEGLLPFFQAKPGGPRRIRADALDEFMARYEDRM